MSIIENLICKKDKRKILLFSLVFFLIHTCTRWDHTLYIIISSVKGEVVNIFSFAGHMVSTNSVNGVGKQMGEAVLIKLHLQTQVATREGGCTPESPLIQEAERGGSQA